MKIRLLFALILLAILPFSAGSFLKLAPEDNFSTNQEINFSYESDTNLTNCILYIDNNNITSFQNVTANLTYSYLYTPNNGFHNWTVKCIDINETVSSKERTFNFDNELPKINLLSPNSTIKSSDVNITLTTAEASKCKTDSSNKSFTNLNYDLDNTYTKEHSITLKEIANGHHTYYIKCKDKIGNINTKEIEFNVKLPITATLDIDANLDDDENYFLPAGRKKINIRLSQSVSSPPILYYLFGTSKVYIPLMGHDRDYNGYIILNQKVNDRVGVFYLVYNNEEIKIDNGRMFVVDSLKPPAPDDVRASFTNKRVYLKWHYRGEKIDYFNVYRAENENVEFLDAYKKTNREYLQDSNLEEGKTYYYKISAVDLAGNEGTLSPIIKIQIPNKESIKTKKPGLSKETLVDINSTLENLKKLKLKLENGKTVLENYNDIKAKAFIKDYGFIKTLKNKLDDVNQNIKLLKNPDINKIRSQLKDIKQFITETEEIAVSDVKFEGESSGIATISEATLKTLLQEYLSLKTTNKSLPALKEISKIQEDIKIENTATVFTAIKINGGKKTYTLISKDISYSGTTPLSNLIILEYIPKTTISSTDYIKFISGNYEILKKDPLIAYQANNLELDNNNIKYYLNSFLSETKTIKTIVFPRNVTFTKQEKQLPTGLSVAKLNLTKINFLPYLAVLLVSLYLYYLIGVKKTFLTQKRVIQNERDSRNFKMILNQAHREIDNLNYNASKNIYLSLLSILKSEIPLSNLSEEDKTNLRLLHKKLTLYKNIGEAYNYYETQEFEKLKEKLNDLRKDIFNFRLKERGKTQLSSYLTQWYFHLQNITDYQ